ncbi:cupin domain-containing protein [Knoellia sp. CPCC 206453]|uniref:cupin domain-containing protein n=1 Tax=Knoellia pratensis TaxID=3404796 RepID=UPI0036245D25
MSAPTTATTLVRNVESAERRWFAGGGVHTWLAKAQDTGGTFLLCEMTMDQGKATPLHTHPADETLIVLEGELVLHLDGAEQSVRAGGVAIAPAGVPHAFLVTTGPARMLCLHTPGTCEAFYLGASEPIDAMTTTGVVDFDRVAMSARANGGIELLGPPPFTQPSA